MAIARQTFADLKKTTMQTFFKICPRELIARNNEQDGFTEFHNKSVIYWLHLDKVDESTLRGLEINSSLIDQAEEMDEKVYDVLDGRIGRWDNAEIPDHLLEKNPLWPSNALTGRRLSPSYNILLCNPDTQFHFIFRKFHPDSLERNSKYFYVEGEWDPSLGSLETYEEALSRGPEWVEKYVRGQWGISNAQIHRLSSASLLEFDANFLERLLSRAALTRVLDHGDSSPTCCLWFATLNGVHICYREYYTPGQPISFHRRAISDLSANEQYTSNIADPQIFKKTGQKDGAFWTTADEYLDPSLSAPVLSWIPGDNNEFATRNRINELLRPNKLYTHPTSGESPAPGLYFIKKSDSYPNGCFHSVKELQSQRRKSLGYVDGAQVYCDDREESITDHSYDCIRYYIASHALGRSAPVRTPPPHSFKWYKFMAERRRKLVAMST